MSEDSLTVNVSILGKSYRVGCPPAEREALLTSARALDGRMREIRERMRLHTNEGLAVIAALNVMHELLDCQSRLDGAERQLQQRLESLNSRIDAALPSDS